MVSAEEQLLFLFPFVIFYHNRVLSDDAPRGHRHRSEACSAMTLDECTQVCDHHSVPTTPGVPGVLCRDSRPLRHLGHGFGLASSGTPHRGTASTLGGCILSLEIPEVPPHCVKRPIPVVAGPAGVCCVESLSLWAWSLACGDRRSEAKRCWHLSTPQTEAVAGPLAPSEARRLPSSLWECLDLARNLIRVRSCPELSLLFAVSGPVSHPAARVPA